MNLTLQFDEAVSLLDAYTSADGSAFSQNEDRLAIITHWLQSPHITPPYTNKHCLAIWERFLKSYAFSQKYRPQEQNKLKKNLDKYQLKIIYSNDKKQFNFLPKTHSTFSFIDLFAGIGGFRIALQNLGGRCVFSSEWDSNAKKTYYQNYGEYPYGDIRHYTGTDVSDEQIDSMIPDHDVLAAGFPCQPFSLAGVSSRNARNIEHGFACDTQGTLFFDIVRIAHVKRPKVLFLENVKNLVNHDNGKTFKIIQQTIEEELGYSFNYKLIDARTTVPQKRVRCYMVCFRNPNIQFKFEESWFSGESLPLKGILESDPSEKYTISDKLWLGHQNRSRRNKARGTGFVVNVADIEQSANTLVARYGKDGKECLIPQNGRNPRMLTERECARLQGYPEEFLPSPVRTHAYKQFGNSVAVPVIEKLGQHITTYLKRHKL